MPPKEIGSFTVRKNLSDMLAQDEDRKTVQISQKRKPALPKTWQGKATVIFYMEDAPKVQLKVLCAEQHMTQQDILIEATNLLFEKYGKSRIAQ